LFFGDNQAVSAKTRDLTGGYAPEWGGGRFRKLRLAPKTQLRDNCAP
jgi:hypothetical protein